MERNQAIFLIIQYLNDLKLEPEVGSVDNLEAATQCLAENFSINTDDINQKEEYALESQTLLELLAAGKTQLGAKSYNEELEELQENKMFQQFLGSVKSKGFFNDTKPGEPEYKARYRRMVTKFKQRMNDSKANSKAAVAAGPTNEEKAEKFKVEGNETLKAKNYDAAVELYSKAIDVCPDGPKSHIYFANRAMARHYLKQHLGAVDDCNAAIERNPAYAKAYTRLGLAQQALNDWSSAVENHKKAVELEPSNKSSAQYLKTAQQKYAAVSPSYAGTPSQPSSTGMAMPPMPPGGMGGMPGMGGNPLMNPQMMAGVQQMMQNNPGMANGMMSSFQQMMQNPAMMQQAMGMMSDPAMMAQAQGMMSNPAMMQQAMEQMQNANGGAGGIPDLN
eukprot:CAMPEP_0185746028 /NCGR_PEP_ID=MMETSP1174-20130828/4433_1 /TAXON_ID=35687 /ORGANISM="Dictyocha speculum, Strain CCMP1381" /LENGTH=390 /DNA_ID=CAMNT_0028420383 /DNA_START=17 /DNA_END=1189 /DNA_ORIENTATION=+